MPVVRECQNCHQTFITSAYKVLEGKGIYCSLACYNAVRLRLPTTACRACGNSFVRYTTGPQWYCSQRCRWSRTARTQRFWQKVQRCDHGETCPYCCWLWQGSRTPENYGSVVYWSRETTHTPAHRIAWELWHGIPMPANLLCAHYCHTPPCCNPHHLHMGTQKENRADSVRDNRTAWGENNSQHKLTTADILRIVFRWNQGASSSKLARAFGVSDSNILAIIHRKTWRRVTDTLEIRPPHVP